MSAVYIEYINDVGDTETLSLNATTQVSVKAVSMVPEQLVEAGYDVATNVINKGFDITFSGIIASGNSDVDPVEYLNKLYALRASRQPFRVVSGDPNVLTNVHSRCLFKDITRNQNKDVGIVGSHTAYELSFSIKSIRVADLAEVREVRQEEIDLLEPKKSTASTTKQVSNSEDELYRKAQYTVNKYGVIHVSNDTGKIVLRNYKQRVTYTNPPNTYELSGQEAVDYVYEQSQQAQSRLEKQREEAAKNSLIKRGLTAENFLPRF